MAARSLSLRETASPATMLALVLRDGRERAFGMLQLIDALDREGGGRAFGPGDERLVQAMAVQAARLPGLAAD